MAELKIKADSGGGTVSLKGPSTTTSNAAVQLTLPVDDGTANQYLKTDGSGVLSWATLPTDDAGLYGSYAVVGERLDASTAAGTFTQGAYRIRIIDEEFYDPDGIVSLSNNQFTLQAGTYLIWWSCPGYVVDKHHAKLYNVTDSANVAAGEACKVGTSSSTQTRSSGMARVTISGAKAFEIRHICASTKADNGLGENAANSDISDNIITWVQIWKEN